MKAVILAGGRGTRLGEETLIRPKPMVQVGDRPIILHILEHYAHYGLTEFVVALGYMGDQISEYLLDLQRRSPAGPDGLRPGDWTLELVDTGLDTDTGGRVKRVAPYVDADAFMLTYGDGVADVDLHRLLAFHRAHGRLATVTAVHPPPRFGQLHLRGDQVVRFDEKPLHESLINGGFFVLEPAVIDLIDGDETSFEHDPLDRLVAGGELMAYRHESFWQCMDAPRDKEYLDALWAAGDVRWQPWRTDR
ncbi:MAG: sugar phosphate nucleotidyltransferase [Acidimicrobiales bacterium]